MKGTIAAPAELALTVARQTPFLHHINWMQDVAFLI